MIYSNVSLQGKVQPQLAGVHVLGIINHALGKHRSNRHLATPNSILPETKLGYILVALRHLPDGRIMKRQSFVLVENGDVFLVLPWLMARTRQHDAAQEAPEEENIERTS